MKRLTSPKNDVIAKTQPLQCDIFTSVSKVDHQLVADFHEFVSLIKNKYSQIDLSVFDYCDLVKKFHDVDFDTFSYFQSNILSFPLSKYIYDIPRRSVLCYQIAPCIFVHIVSVPVVINILPNDVSTSVIIKS